MSNPVRRRVLVTGVTGQDGQYLCEQLRADGARIFGLWQEEFGALPAGVTPVAGDLRDGASLRRAIDEAEPDEIYNLGGITFVPASWDDPDAVRDVNATGTARLLEAVRASGAAIRVLHASSAEMFGPPTGRPQNEETPLAPESPYGRSKAEAHEIVARARDEQALFCCSAILFNHESPRRPPGFVTRKITMGAARISRGLEKKLLLGNLDAGRDWGYAPEYVEGMRAMLAAPTPRDYVLATGRAITVGDFVRLAFERVGLDWRAHVEIDPAFARAGDSAARIGDPSRIARELGWKAKTSVEELVAIMVDADLALLD